MQDVVSVSAVTELVFSLVNTSFGQNQVKFLENYVFCYWITAKVLGLEHY